MAYNRWLSPDELMHHQVKGAHWGVHNGPPYPLDRSKSDGHKLLTKGDGSPQGKKRYKTSEKTAHKRAERKARTDVTDIESAKKKLRELGVDKSSIDEFDLWAQEIPEKERAKWMRDEIDSIAKNKKKPMTDEEVLNTFKRSDSYGGMYDKKISNGSSKPVDMFMFDDPPEKMKKKIELVRELERNISAVEKHVKSTSYDKDVRELLLNWAGRDVSKEEFNKSFRLTNIYVTPDSAELTFFDDGKFFGYHDLCIEYDPKTKRVSYASLQG